MKLIKVIVENNIQMAHVDPVLRDFVGYWIPGSVTFMNEKQFSIQPFQETGAVVNASQVNVGITR